MSQRITISGGRIIDPGEAFDQHQTLHIADGRVVAIGAAPDGFSADRCINASGLLLIPGLVDLSARMREPGQEHKGTIASESYAAASGGVTSLCCPPDTVPVIDTQAVAEQILHLAASAGLARVMPVGALTQGLAGQQLSEMATLQAAGCIAMGNARRPIVNTLVMRRALEYAATLGVTVFFNSEDPWLAADGCIHDGQVATRLGLAGIPECAEVIAVARDLLLIEQTGVRAHFGQLSSARAVELIADAKSRGLPVTADVAAHQLFLTEIDVADFNPLCHLKPPLRGQRDRDALRAAVADGTIDAICSDHQPHDRDAKLAPFAATEAGASGIETLLPLTLRLVDDGLLTLTAALATVTTHPARVLGNQCGSLRLGADADLTLVDPNEYWQVSETTLLSHGKNSPFLGWELKGKVRHTLVGGHTTYSTEV